jgi:hypothetical protein
MIKVLAVLTAILAASLSVPTKAEANPAWVGAVLIGAGLRGVILSFRQATRHLKQARMRDRTQPNPQSQEALRNNYAESR